MLSGVNIFTNLNAKQRREIASLCYCRHYQAGQEIISYNATSKDVYFVINGQVQATVFSITGKQIVLNDIGPGNLFGELAAIDNQPRSAFVVALAETTICAMSQSSFWYVLQHYQTVNEAVLLRLSYRVRELCGRVIEISTLPVKNRIHAEILRLALQYPVLKNKIIIQPTPTHFDIANHIGTHREAVSREMAQLKKLGIIQRNCNNQLVIKDIKRLRNLVREAPQASLTCLKAS